MKETFIKLHISVLLAGLTGIFGKLITLNEGLLVWCRMLFASVIFFLFLAGSRKLQKISGRDFGRMAGAGALLGLHWVFFYGSIKYSTISIGVVCFSLSGFFTSILEPVLLHKRFSFRELLFSFIALTGVVFIFSFDIRYRLGIGMGAFSSLLYSLFSIRTRQIGQDYPSRTLLLYEMTGGFLVLSCLLSFYLVAFPVSSVLPGTQDLTYLLLLAVFCTIGLQLLQIQVLQKISAFTVSLTYNLEPLYSILLAMIFFHEARELNFAFYIGVSLILLSVLLQAWDTMRKRKTVTAS